MDRGATFTLDMIVALFLFMVIVLSVLWLWGEAYRYVYGMGDVRARMRKALDLSDMLVKTSGNPVNWFELDDVTTDNTRSIGLAKEENVLDSNRLDKLNSSNVSIIKTIFGLSKEDFELTVTANWTTTPAVFYNISSLDASSTKVYVVERVALLDDERVQLRLRIGYS
jgi:hypothetical protein